MIDKENITHLAEEGLASSDCFLVDVNIHPGNLIVVEIDHNQAVGIDDCVVLSQYIEQRFDRDMEDYELEVGSSGIGTPFKIVRQYIKNCSNEVEVLLKNGLKLKGILKSANESGITLTVAVKTKPEGSKRKITVLEEQTFLYDEIKYTKNIIRFK